jgi:uncharacterized membrane protein YfcA
VLIAAVLTAVLLGTLAQSVSGIGFALVCGPLLVAALGPQNGVRLAVLLSLLLNVVLLTRLWRMVDRRRTLLLLAPSAFATPLLAAGARGLPMRPAAALAGAVVLIGVALLASGARWHAARGTAGAVAAGLLGAATNVVAAVAGPVVALWAANAQWPADVQRASLQAYFLGLNCVALPSLGLPSVGGGLLLGCVLALGLGALLGAPLARRVSEEAARRTTLALAAAGGAAVLVRALAF